MQRKSINDSDMFGVVCHKTFSTMLIGNYKSVSMNTEEGRLEKLSGLMETFLCSTLTFSQSWL